MKQANTVKGYLFVIASAVIYGCMPLMTKWIYLEGVNTLTLVLLRNCLALPALAVLAFMHSKTLRIPPKALPGMGMIALMGCCVTPVLLFLSYRYIPSGTATVFHFIYPAAVVLAGVLFLKERIRGWNLLSVVLCVAGICLFYTPGQRLDWRGCACALLSGITYCAYVILLSGFRYRKIQGYLFSFYVAAVSSVVMLAVCLFSGQLALPTTVKGWLLCIFFALAITTGAVALFQQGTFLIGGQRASILSTLEPITSIIVGALVFQEAVNGRTVTGSALVILASILIALGDIKKQEKAE